MESPDAELDVVDPVYVAQQNRRAVVTPPNDGETEMERTLREKEEEEQRRARTAPARATRNANAAQKAIIVTEEADKANTRTVLKNQQALASKYAGFNEATAQVLFQMYEHPGDREALMTMLQRNQSVKDNQKLREAKKIEKAQHLADLERAQREKAARQKAEQRVSAEQIQQPAADEEDPDALELRQFQRLNQAPQQSGLIDTVSNYLGDVMVGTFSALQEQVKGGKKRKLDAAGDLRAYLKKMFNEGPPDPDDFALLAGLLSSALDDSEDEEPEPHAPQPQPEQQPDPTEMSKEIAELKRQLREANMRMDEKQKQAALGGTDEPVVKAAKAAEAVELPVVAGEVKESYEELEDEVLTMAEELCGYDADYMKQSCIEVNMVPWDVTHRFKQLEKQLAKHGIDPYDV